MLKTLACTTILIGLYASGAMAAPLALDHLKSDLDSRFNEVYSSRDLDKSHKARALTQIRSLQSQYSSAVSLSYIPSQKKAAEDMCRQLSREISSFDKTLNEYKSACAKRDNKSAPVNEDVTQE